MNYLEACAYINQIGRFSVKNSHEHTRRALALLGNPEQGIGFVIHVAGTNGKGSVCAYLESVLRRAGYRTALFTSPHLVRMNERIRIGGEAISDGTFLAAFQRVRAASEILVAGGAGHPSYFEFLFLMAMVCFREAGTDAAVIETGLGGRLDATNCMEHPAFTVITQIGMDHMQYLGNTVEEIAAEKAGILKEGVPCVCLAFDTAVHRVIAERAEKLSAPLAALFPEDVRITGAGDGEIDFSTSFRYDGHADFRIRAAAPYQAENAALAVLALKEARRRGVFPEGRVPSGEEVLEGLIGMYWPARMEEIAPGVYLDGAHNIDGVRRFAEAVRAVAGGREAHLLFAAVKDKDCRGMVRTLLERCHFQSIIVTELPGDRRMLAEELAELFAAEGTGEHVTAVPSFREAYRALRRRQRGGCAFICGSLYLAGCIEELEKG